MKSLKISLIIFVALYLEWKLLVMWQADSSFAYGKNLDSVSHYVDAYPYLKEAVAKNPGEPTFRDELSFNEAVLAVASISSATASAQLLANQAMNNSNLVVEAAPNSMPFWKTRTRVFYQLATIDSKYYLEALAAIQKAASLAPTDAKVHYNLGILYGRTGDISSAIKAFEETVTMKPDYRDAYYALALYFDQAGNRPKARETMNLVLERIGQDSDVLKWLEENK